MMKPNPRSTRDMLHPCAGFAACQLLAACLTAGPHEWPPDKSQYTYVDDISKPGQLTPAGYDLVEPGKAT